MESESKLKESLIECARVKEGLEMKCAVLERENLEQSQTVGCVRVTHHISYFFFAVYIYDMSLSTRSFKINSICWIVNTVYPQCHPPPFDSQPAKGGSKTSQVCSPRLQSSDGGHGTKDTASGWTTERTGWKVQGASLSSQAARRPAGSDSESGAEGVSEPQRGSTEPGGAGEPPGHTVFTASKRGEEEYSHCYVYLPVTCFL